jgi:uncharacterized protein YjbI with pentapeptide repeats
MTSTVMGVRALVLSLVFAWAGMASAQDFSGQDLTGVQFSNADFSGADFSGANLTDAGFFRTNLEGANFDGAILEGTFFVQANVSSASFVTSSGRPVFSGTDMRGAFLDPVEWPVAAIVDGSDCSGATFVASGMRNMLMRNSVCTGANFFLIDGFDLRVASMNFENANFERANLESAELLGSNLRNANFVNANLRNCDFSNSDLTGAKF